MIVIDASDEPISNHAPPKVLAHYKSYEKISKMAEKRYAAPDDQAGMILDAAVGCNSNARHNMIWHPETGMSHYFGFLVQVYYHVQHDDLLKFKGNISKSENQQMSLQPV